MLRSLFVLTIVVLIQASPAGAGYELRRVADSGDAAPLPGGGTEDFIVFRFHNAYVLQDGEVVFEAAVTQGDFGFRLGLWRETDEGLSPLAYDGSPIPGVDGFNFDSGAAGPFQFRLYVDPADRIALYSGVSGGGVQPDTPQAQHLFEYDRELETWRILIRGDDPASAIPMLDLPHFVRFNGGQAQFLTVLGTQLDQDPAVVLAGPNRFTVSAELLYGSDVPGLDGYEITGLEANTVYTVLNPGGDQVVGLHGSRPGFNPIRGVFRKLAGGEFLPLLTAEAIPLEEELLLSQLAINASADAAFMGHYLDQAGIWTLGAGGPTPVFVQGDAADGTGTTFRKGLGFALRDDGTVLFLAETEEEVTGSFFSRQAKGIWYQPEPGASPVKIAYEGDAAPGFDEGVTYGGFAGVGGFICNAAGDFAITAEVVGPGLPPTGSNGLWVGDSEDLGLLLRTSAPFELEPGDTRTPIRINLRNSPLAASNPGPGIINTPGTDGLPGVMNENGAFAFEVVWAGETSTLVVAETGLVVNSTGNSADANPGDGSCDTGGSVDGEPECTLRAAIEEANALEGRDRIRFDIPTTDPGHAGGVWTLKPTTGIMPGIHSEMVIDASTQPGYVDHPIVVLDGSLSRPVSNDPGFNVTGDGSEIHGFSIGNWGGQGIRISGDNNTVTGCWIGVAPDGVSPIGSREDGVFIARAAGNRIGGTGPGDGCVLANNGLGWPAGGGTMGQQIVIFGEESVNNRVQGCILGLDAAGQTALPNPPTGVFLWECSDNLIGGDSPGAGNVIAAHGYGIDMESSQRNRIEGNWIGLSADGASGRGNGRVGIRIRTQSTDNIVGGVTDAAGTPPGNVISGTQAGGGNGHGILVEDESHRNVILGNAIGTNAGVTGFISNRGSGILLRNVDSTRVGALNERGANVITASHEYGVWVREGKGTQILNNFIGTEITRTLLPGNFVGGVFIEESEDNRIEGGVVAYNLGAGIRIPTGDRHRLHRTAAKNNGGLGIDLGAGGVDPNDGSGVANAGQPRPVLTRARAMAGAGDVGVTGTLTAAANASYAIDFYGSTGCDPSGFGEGERYWQQIEVVTDEDGLASLGTTLIAALVPPGTTRLTATATDAAGNSSEFSNCIPIDPPVTAEGIIVNSAGDAGDANPGDGECDTGAQVGGEAECTLRAAIEETNALAGGQAVAFAIGDTPVITPQSELPLVAGPVLLDATTQPGYEPGNPSVTLDGSSAPGASGLVVGGDGAVIRGFRIENFEGDGIRVENGANHVLTGNVIGGIATAAPGHAVGVANGGNGITVVDADSTMIGGETPGDGNLISGNGGAAVAVLSGTGNQVLGLSGEGNARIDHDLVGGTEDAFGVTANDPGDADEGPNGLQNHPLLTAATFTTRSVLVEGTLASTPNTSFVVHVHAGEDCHESGHGGGSVLLGGVPVTTDGQGDAVFSGVFQREALPPLPAEPELLILTATAEGPEGASEFGNCARVDVVAVRLVAFAARRAGAGAELRWQTEGEVDHLGFDVYRETQGQSQRVNTGLVTGGPDYAFMDPSVPAGPEVSYLLEGLARDGSRERFGPYLLEAAPPPSRATLRALRNPAPAGADLLLSLPEQAPVRLRVFGVDGRVIRELVNGTLPAGERMVRWDGRGDDGRSVAAGTYFIQLVTPGVTRTVRSVILGR